MSETSEQMVRQKRGRRAAPPTSPNRPSGDQRSQSSTSPSRRSQERSERAGRSSGERESTKRRGKERGKGQSKRRGKGRSKGRSKGGNKSRNFAVWRAVTLVPRVSLKTALSGMIYLCCLIYAGAVIYTSQEQLQMKVNAQGVKRTFFARQALPVPLPNGSAPITGQVLDRRRINLWSELKRRSSLPLNSEPPLINHTDPQVNQKAWQNALTARKVDFIESRGLGSSGEVSLVWPPLPAPQPTLVVGHIFNQVVWIHPQHGVVLSPPPPEWRDAPALRLPPQMSRRW